MIYYQVFCFKLIKLEDLISAYTDCVKLIRDSFWNFELVECFNQYIKDILPFYLEGKKNILTWMTSDQPIIWFTYEREPPHFNGASDSFLGGFAVRWIQKPSLLQNDFIRRHGATSSTTPRKMYRGIKAKGLLLWHEHFSEMDWTKEAEEIR